MGLAAMGLLLSSTVWAQDPAAPAAPAAAAEPPPTLQEAIAFVNTSLDNHTSGWRPCKTAGALELLPDGSLSLTLVRGSYCEDVRILANVHELDPRAVSFEVGDEAVVRLPCLEEATCARFWQRRKRHNDESWVLRDTEWIPAGPGGQEHQTAALELTMSSRPLVAAQVAAALGYVVRAAQADPAYVKPSPARFEQEVASAQAPGGT